MSPLERAYLLHHLIAAKTLEPAELIARAESESLVLIARDEAIVIQSAEHVDLIVLGRMFNPDLSMHLTLATATIAS